MNTAENVLNKLTNLIRGTVLDKSDTGKKKSSVFVSEGKTLIRTVL